jgi:dTDP-4-amino-4,6-dideoxygalactose transaminase
MIGLANLTLQYKNMEKEILNKVEEVFELAEFINGKYLQEFEQEFCKEHQIEYGCGCSNGTAALFLALQALGIKEGDEVITVPNTFIATAEAICHTGATPVFVDIDPNTYTIDVTKIEAAITNKTQAIIPVHLYGNPCDMDAILAIAKRHDLFVVEDCAQAHLATFNNRMIGTFGDFSAFSFFPGKNLGAAGDAGFVGTATQERIRLIRKLLDHGRIEKYKHDLVSFNYRMDDLQAAILSIKLKYLHKWTKKRQEHAAIYNGVFQKQGFSPIKVLENAQCVYHVYAIQTSNRDEVQKVLLAKGIKTAIHYPIPLHLQPALQYLNYKEGDFAVTEKIAKRTVSLPLHPEMTESEVEYVCKEFLKIAKY